MVSTQSNFPNVAATENVDPANWTNVNNVKIQDATVATWPNAATRFYDTCTLIVGGARTGNNNADNAQLAFQVLTDQTYGSSSDGWGATLTPSKINSSNFGVSLAFDVTAGGAPTDYINVSDFGFTVPSDATIVGVEVIIRAKYEASTTDVDSIEIIVYYEGGLDTQIKVDGDWRDVLTMKVNISDVWKEVTGIKVNIGDVWKTVF